MVFKHFMNCLYGSSVADSVVSDVTDIAAVETREALRALDVVGCVEVSPEVAEKLGAFDEEAVSIDDVLDDED